MQMALAVGARKIPIVVVPNQVLATADNKIPVIIGDLIREGKADCVVLPTADKWFGMTYKEDIPTVKDAFKDLVANGVYPENIK
jgi:hypothetical protein